MRVSQPSVSLEISREEGHPGRSFEKAHPGTQIRLHEGDLKTRTGWLDSGQIDIALTYEFGLSSTLLVTPPARKL